MQRQPHPLPKLLPWFANRAGITEQRAAEIWREAESQARTTAPEGSGLFHAEALRIAGAAIDAEALTLRTPAALVLAALNAHRHFWCATLAHIERVYRCVFRQLYGALR